MGDQGGIGRAFGGGFFGCFGVLAAVVLCLVLLVMCGSLSQSRKQAAADRAELAPDLGNACASALAVGQRRFFGFERFTAAAAPQPEQLGGDRFRCTFPDGESRFVLEGRTVCAGRAGCVLVDRGTLDDVVLLERSR